jgi:tRNA(Ile)-lysidine synthase
MQGWVHSQQGALVALIVDHGLRAESGTEAELTQVRLASRGIAPRILKIAELAGGAAMQARARAARHQALARAARAEGCLFLALGHHAGDQSETVAMRAARGDSGLEGMAGWAARGDVVLIRPLLTMAPERLRAFLQAEMMEWVEDPSNENRTFERVRWRQAKVSAVAADAGARQAIELEAAAFIAAHVLLRAEGFAVVAAAAMPPVALAALLRVVAGAEYPPGRAQVAALAVGLRPATLGGVRLARTAKFGGGWLLAREPAACAAPLAAAAGAVWDGRFRLIETVPGTQLGALGEAADPLERQDLPALVRRGLPCLRRNGVVISDPPPCRFIPPYPATAHLFAP